ERAVQRVGALVAQQAGAALGRGAVGFADLVATGEPGPTVGVVRAGLSDACGDVEGAFEIAADQEGERENERQAKHEVPRSVPWTERARTVARPLRRRTRWPRGGDPVRM